MKKSISQTLRPSSKTIYLDHAAATPLDPFVRKTMLSLLDLTFANPSSLHRQGREARKLYDEQKKKIADLLGVSVAECIVTSGATESDNLALLGVARAYAAKDKNHILVSSLEHHAVLNAAGQLAKEGFRVEYIPVDAKGIIDYTWLAAAIRPNTLLVSVMYANNEVGTIQPIRDIAKLIRKKRKEYQDERLFLHTDASQAVGYLPYSPRVLGVDAMTFNAAKIYGPKGIGLLYKSKNLLCQPLMYGGGQEGGIRPGTESLALLGGFAHALERSGSLKEKEYARLAVLQGWFLQEFKKKFPWARVNAGVAPRLPHTVHVSFPGYDGEALALYLDAHGISVSTGAACSVYSDRASHVLEAMGLSEAEIKGSLRITMGRSTTKAMMQHVLKCISSSLDKLERQ